MRRVGAARVEDLEGILRLERATEGAPHWGEAVWAGLLGEGETELRGVQVWVVRGDGREVVGVCVVTMVWAAGVAELETVAVAERQRGQGLGWAMCGAAVEWARATGAEAMELEVWEGNARAVRVYEGMGFREVGRRPGYYGTGRDARLMRLVLCEE